MTVLAVVSSSIDGVVRCVEALVDCVDRAEKSGLSCDVVVIDPSGDQRIAEFLDAVDGLLRIGVEDDLTARTAFLAQGHTRNGPLFCLDTTAAPGAGALELLVGAAPHPGWCAVADDRDPAPYAVLHAADLGFQNPVRDDEDLVPGLVSRAAAAGVSVVGVAGAGMIREPSRGERPWGATVVGPGRVRVGVASYSGHDTVVKTYAPLEEVEIGSYCSLANEVRLVLPGGRLFDGDGAEVLLDLRGLHRMETATTFPIGVLVPDEPYELPGDEHRGEKMIIGDDVWIGYRATVVGAVRIGAGAVVGAGSVVVSDVSAYTVVGGVPARVIRPRFDARHAEALQRIRWWDWPVETVRGSHRQFLRPVEDFVAHFDLSTFVTVPVEES